jgi:beta-galactosidase
MYGFSELSCNEAVKAPDVPWKLLKPAAAPPFAGLVSAEYGREDSIEYGSNHWGKEGMLQDIADKLSRAGVDYDISDTHLGLERMARYDLVVCCTYEFMDDGEARKLVEYARLGGRLMIGPTVPRLDRDMFGSDVLGAAAREAGTRIRVMRNADDAVLSAMAYAPAYRASDERIELVAQCEGERELLFAANVSGDRVEFSISGLGASKLIAVWGIGKGAPDQAVSVAMPAYSIFVWEVHSDD